VSIAGRLHWSIDNQNINIVKSGQLLLKDIIDLGSHYSIEGNFGANNNGQYGINILFNNSINEYYTARIYPGQWGGVYLYKHVGVWDVGGKTIARNLSSLLDSSYILKVITKDKLVYIYLNDELLITHEFDNVVIGKNMGLHTLGNITDVNIHDITISY
tara:strand:+ start:25 stop:501 length:477 start_codon:yes stop_codon:yes gene_type:complete